jgi:hypothetical protein
MKKLLLALALLLASPVFAAGKFSIFDQVGGVGAGLTPAKGQMFYTSDAFGKISPLAIGTTGYCLVVDGSGIPAWSNVCTGVVSSVALSAPTQFSVGGSPVTSSGTLALSWQNVSQNYGLFGPTSGSGVPTFRQITGGDLPAWVTTKGDLITYNGSTTAAVRLPVGADATVLTADSTQATGLKWSSASAGTVTSVAASVPTGFTIGGSPVTSSGTLAIGFDNVAAHTFLFNNTGSSAHAAWNTLAAADLGITTKGDLLTKSTVLARLGVGTDGYVLTADSTQATGLSWTAVTGTGTVTSVAASVPTGFSVSGSPITASGTLGITLDSQTANKFLGSPYNTSGTPAFRGLNPVDLGLSVKGDLLVTDGTGLHRLAVGTDTYALLADSSQTYGVKWSSVGVGTVTSVAQTVPTGFGISGSPVTGSGTLALAFGTTTGNYVLRTNSGGTVGWGTLGTGANYISIAQPSGAGHAPGLVPDTPSLAGTSNFLREDSSWALPPQGTMTSLTVTVPTEVSLSGSPITTSGTIGLGWNTETANKVFAGPTTGSANTPAFRALVPADMSACVASGALHAAGLVPDPGASAGTARFLREDCSFQTPTFNSSIELKDVSGTPDQTGTSILRFDASTGLQGTANGSGIYTVACTTCAGAGATAMRTDTFTGDNTTTVFTLNSTPVTNGVLYAALNGVAQQATAWSLAGSNVTMTTAPFTSDLLVIGYYTARPSSGTYVQQDFTGAGSTDLTLTYTPAADGVLWISLNGLIQQQTSWSIVGSTTLRMTAIVPSGDIVSIAYVH